MPASAATPMCLDSFALLALLTGQNAMSRVQEVLTSACGNHSSKIWMCEVNFAEVGYQLIRRVGTKLWNKRLLVIAQLPIVFANADRRLSLDAAGIMTRHPMSLADAYCAALAFREGATILTGDPEFQQLEQTIKIE